ncbi:MAG TPA: hypothetical protein VM536_10315, partial [Chloroflexia bacterium]|nr:hypothetical protein [Chloroflexia bacterium]
PLHGVLDYVWSLSLFFAPQLFGFARDREAAQACRLMAGSALATSLFTRYELGLVKVIPFNLHLVGDTLNAVAGLAAPSLLGFRDNPKARTTVLGFVLFEIGAVLLSRRDPQK